MSRAIEIDNCMDCPHMAQITSEYTGDSFDMADEDVICTNPKAPKRHEIRGVHDRIIGRAIVVSERWLKRSMTKIPDWCSLKKSGER